MTAHAYRLRAGHAPDFLRRLFADELVGQGAFDPDSVAAWIPAGADPAPWVAGSLLGCTDIMPAALGDDLGLPAGSTYGAGARRWLANACSWTPPAPTDADRVVKARVTIVTEPDRVVKPQVTIVSEPDRVVRVRPQL